MQSPPAPWPTAAPPRLSASEPALAVTAPDAGETDDIHDVWLRGARLVDLELDRPEAHDLRLDDCDLSGVVGHDAVVRRLALTGTRLRGVVWTGGQCDDVVLEGCLTDQVSLRFSRLRRVTFHDCRLAGIDFYGASFEHVLIENCDLTKAAFDAATVTSLRIRNCDLSGITGANRLRGAEVDASDLPSLAASLATDAGIRIRDA